jgi:hypothetical protein
MKCIFLGFIAIIAFACDEESNNKIDILLDQQVLAGTPAGSTAGTPAGSIAGTPAGSIAGTPAGSRTFHPESYKAPEVHGLDLKQNTQDCRPCHGDQLQGALGPSCDSCHQQGWRTNCTYCHGDQATDQSAPPRDLKNQTDPLMMTFKPHAQHLLNDHHGDWDCQQCHIKPVDVMSLNHIFDDTYGKAEVDFSQGLSAEGVYEGEGKCSNLYCHGTGRVNGAYEHLSTTPSCTTCHPNTSLGGHHGKHLREGVRCDECHADTVSGQTIIDKNLHVNGQKDVVFGAGQMSRNQNTCTGTCHGEGHRSERW